MSDQQQRYIQILTRALVAAHDVLQTLTTQQVCLKAIEWAHGPLEQQQAHREAMSALYNRSVAVVRSTRTALDLCDASNLMEELLAFISQSPPEVGDGVPTPEDDHYSSTREALRTRVEDLVKRMRSS